MPLPHDDLAPVTRLYERLTEALQRTRRDPFNVPVTVAEVYQELVPYRLVRTEIGFDMNADYEHALLRLLAGEGEWVRIEPAHAVDEIRRELRSANPNLSLYRDYAACDVWVRRPPAGSELRSAPAAAAPVAAQKPAAPPAVEPAAAARASSARSPSEQKSAARASGKPLPFAPPPPPAPLAASAAAPPVVEPTQTARSGTVPPVRLPQAEERAAEAVADWQVPIELKDIVLTGDENDAAEFGTITLAGDDRPDDREEQDEERAVALTPMSETPKREAAAAEESAAAPPSGKASRSAGGTRSATPAPAAAPARATPAPAAPPKPAVQAAQTEAARCAFCDSQLPQQRPARFCPYCGADQTTRPCPSCGEPLEPGWAFCITCGATAQ